MGKSKAGLSEKGTFILSGLFYCFLITVFFSMTLGTTVRKTTVVPGVVRQTESGYFIELTQPVPNEEIRAVYLYFDKNKRMDKAERFQVKGNILTCSGNSLFSEQILGKTIQVEMEYGSTSVFYIIFGIN